jgi:hypothetical protein
MQVNKDNYEALLIDYMDGKLGPLETACLMVFLESHPEIRDEIGDLDQCCLDESACRFDAKNELKRKVIPEGDLITEENYLQVFFEDAEGILNASVSAAIPAFLKKNPSLQQEYYSWKNAHLLPEDLVFADKSSLKKTLVRPLYTRYYVAAAIAAVFLLFFISAALYLRMPDPSKPRVEYASQLSRPVPGVRPVDREQPQAHRPDVLILRKNENVLPVNPADRMQDEIAKMSVANSQDATAVLPLYNFGNSEYDTYYTHLLQLIEKRRQLMGTDDTQLADVQNYNRANAVNPDEKIRPSDNGRMGFWEVAEMGVKSYNAFSNKKVKFERTTNSKGKTASVILGTFAFERR